MTPERPRRQLRRVLGWPLALGAGATGFLIWTLQAVSGALERRAPIPSADSSLFEALGFWLKASWFSLPMVLSVLFLALSVGALLSGLVIFGPHAVGTLFRRLHELGGAVPAVLLLMLWRLGSKEPTNVWFVLLLSGAFAIEIAQLLAETGREVVRAQVRRTGHKSLRERWNHFIKGAVSELHWQLANQAALVASSVFGLDAALAFVGLGLDGAPTWGRVIGEVARGWRVAPTLAVLSLASAFGTVVGAYRLVAFDRNRTRTSPEAEANRSQPIESGAARD